MKITFEYDVMDLTCNKCLLNVYDEWDGINHCRSLKGLDVTKEDHNKCRHELCPLKIEP